MEYKVKYEGYTPVGAHIEYRERDGATRLAPTWTTGEFTVTAAGAEEATKKAFDELVKRHVGIIESICVKKEAP